MDGVLLCLDRGVGVDIYEIDDMKGSTELTDSDNGLGGHNESEDDARESVLGGSIPKIAYNSSSLLKASASR